MKSEISFLLELVLDHKLPKEAKKACQDRIREVEEAMLQPAAIARPATQLPMPMQAPSTQRLLDAQVAAPAVPLKMRPAEIDKETGTAIVNTGPGTKGMRKF